MQVLWSRAAQARSSCRCSSCLHATTTLARRTTTAASKRRLKISDVFTACYSTILATAAFADAKKKEERRKEWDRLIEEVQTPSKPGKKKKARNDLDQELGPETEGWEVQKSSFQESSRSISEVAGETLSTFAPFRKPFRDPSAPRVHNPWQDDNLDAWGLPPRTKVPSASETLSALDHALKSSTAERIAARDVDSIYQPGEDQKGDFVDEFLDVDLPNRDPMRPLHVEKMEEMVMKLVNRLLQESKVFSTPVQQEGDAALTVQREMSEMAQRFVALNIGVSRVPRFHFDSSEIVEAKRKKLHHSIYALSFGASRGQADKNVAIAKICYNLLVSEVPPSITTYNMLLNEFHNLKRYDLGQVVIDSFFYESKLKPNKRTIRLFLDHYRNESNFEGFRNVVQRMRGTGGDMRIRARTLRTLVYTTNESWALSNKVIHRNGYLHQKATRSRTVFNSLILGSLEFEQLRAAIRFARAALREGQEISADTLGAIIKTIISLKDFYAGQSLLRALVSQWENGSIISVTEFPTNLRLLMNKLLILCGIDTNSKRWHEMLPWGMSPIALSNILQRMQAGFIADAVELSAKFILKIDAVLGMSGLDFSYSEIEPYPSAEDTAPQRIQWALEVAEKQSCHEELQRAKRTSELREAWQDRLHVVGRIVDDGDWRVLMFESRFWKIQVISKSLQLHSLLQEKAMMSDAQARVYLLALQTSITRPYESLGYPMFRRWSSLQRAGDPISYLEANVFDVKKELRHQSLMSELLSTKDSLCRVRLTKQRLKTFNRKLNKYLNDGSPNPEHQRRRAAFEMETFSDKTATEHISLDDELASLSLAYRWNNVQDMPGGRTAEFDGVNLPLVAFLPPLESLSTQVKVARQ